MNADQAHTAVSISALVVAGIWVYRKLIEGQTGSRTAAPTSHFVVGFGFVFITLSILADAAPAVGGMFAVLVATGDLLINGTQLTNDLQAGLKAQAAATK